MDSVKLLNRLDIKYIFHRDQLRDILERASADYRVLSIADARFSRYETHYFDTTGYEMYTQHHNGKLNRYKVRFRDYVDSGISFFEIKYKTNKGRTIKERVKNKHQYHLIEGKSGLLLTDKTRYSAEMLHEAIQVNYNRITLVSKNLTERLTIDFGLNFRANGKEHAYPDLVIAEVKQDRASHSPFIALMKEKFIHKRSLSKYCLGIATLNTQVKVNNFKPKILFINNLRHVNN